jgi:hypothetical protein
MRMSGLIEQALAPLDTVDIISCCATICDI